MLLQLHDRHVQPSNGDSLQKRCQCKFVQLNGFDRKQYRVWSVDGNDIILPFSLNAASVRPDNSKCVVLNALHAFIPNRFQIHMTFQCVSFSWFYLHFFFANNASHLHHERFSWARTKNRRPEAINNKLQIIGRIKLRVSQPIIRRTLSSFECFSFN